MHTTVGIYLSYEEISCRKTRLKDQSWAHTLLETTKDHFRLHSEWLKIMVESFTNVGKRVKYKETFSRPVAVGYLR